MQQIEKDVEWLKANIKHLTDGQAMMQEAITKIADAVSDLHAIQNDVTRHGDEINLMRTRYHEQASFMSAKPCHSHTDSIARLVARADDIEQRVEHMETEMPTVKLASSWLFRGIVAVISLLGVISAGVMIHWMSGGFAT